jgi:TatD DNase family protein
MEFFDTHTHVQFNAFKKDGDEVIRRSLDVGMWLVLPGTQIDTSRRAVEYAERWDSYLPTSEVGKSRIWAAVGLHPLHLEEMEIDESEEQPLVKFKSRKEEFDRDVYGALAKHPKTVAIGECGLDYWHRPKGRARREEFMKRQHDTLIAQLDLAADVGKPVILHCRVAHDDLIEIIKNRRITSLLSPPGVIHSYTGSIDHAKKFMDMGYYFGFNGIIFKNISMINFDEIIRFIPLERMVLETDSPYLTPPQVKAGEKQGEFVRNEPINIHYVAEKIAQLKNISVEEVAEVTNKNARKVFRV